MIAREIDRAPADELARRLARAPGFVWLDGDGSAQGRRSYLGIAPSEVVEARFGDPDPLAAISAMATDEGEFADVPRYIGFISYDAAWSGDAGARHARTASLPVLRFARYDAVVQIDHETESVRLIGETEAVNALECELGRPGATLSARCGEPVAEPREVHAHAIRDALDAIARGDVYEVNLARRWHASYEGDPLALFLAMRDASPVPFGAYIAGEGFAIASRSMERFLRFDAVTRRLETRPIKGTIAREDGSDDARRARALRDDDKERAEHVMIVDLMRNDLGRVAEVGSVEVTGLFEVEPYAALSHLVSTVACRVEAGIRLEGILRATFPPGSVTGAPKVTAMRTIEALERHARGPYTGAIGFVTRGGDLSLSVAIRTAVVQAGTATYFAGGGIVSASIPDREVSETELKAKVFADAIARGRES